MGVKDSLQSSMTQTTYNFTLTKNGNEYYLVITGADGFSLTSNTITINYQSQSIKIDATQDGSTLNSTNDIPYGTPVSLNFVNNSNNFVMDKSFTYQWEVLKDGAWTADGSATTSPIGFPVNVINTQSYRLVVMNGTTQVATSNVISLGAKSEPLYITNTATSSSSGTTSSSSSSTSSDNSNSSMSSTMNVNYGDSNITLGISGYWATQKLINKQDFTYSWQTQQPGSSTWTTVSSDPTYKVPAVTTSGVSYRLVVSDSKISGFNLTSAPLTVNLTDSTINLSSTSNSNTWNTTTSPYTATDAVPFANAVTLTVSDNDNVNLNTGYTFTWYFVENGVATKYGTTTNPTLKVNVVRNASFYVVASNSNSNSFTSSAIYVGMASPSLSISATSSNSTTPATSFDYASYLTLSTSNNLSSLASGSWTYSWTQIGNSSFSNANPTVNFLLTANSTFTVTYNYTPASSNTSNPYYEGINFTSSPATFSVKMTNSSNNGSTSGQTTNSTNKNSAITPMINSNTTSVKLGQSATLSLANNSYWTTYSFPPADSNYAFTYSWYDSASTTPIKSGTFSHSNQSNLSCELSDLSTTGSYYLVISCTNDKNTVFKLESNIIQITVTNPTITIGVATNSSFDSVSVGVSSTNTVTLQVVPSQTSAYWYTTCKYQWVSYNSSTNTWNTPNDGDWTSASANTSITDAVGIDSYKLAVKIANTILYSNIFTVYEQSKVNQSITLSQPTQVGYGQSATTTATCTGLTGSGWTYSWLVKNSNGTFVPIDQVLTNSDLYTASNSSLTINSVVDNYVVELQATNGSNTITSNQVSFTYTQSTLKITTATTSLVDFSTTISPIEIDTTNSTWKAPTKYASDLVYTWYQYDETNSTGWEEVQSGSSAQYTPYYQGSQPLAMGGNEFYLVITDSKIPDYKIKSDTITITVSLASDSYMSINPTINANTTNLDKQAILSLMDEDYWTSYCLQAVNNGNMVTYSWYNTSSSYPLSVNIFNENSKFTYQLNNLNKTDEYYFAITITNHHHDVIASYKSNFIQIPVNPNN